MEIINRITLYLTALNQKDFKNYLIITIAFITLVISGLMYYVQLRSLHYIKEIKQFHQLSEKAASVVQQNYQIQKEEDRIQDILNKHKDFSIKTYFEHFCREHHLMPEPNWETMSNPIEGNEKFEEVTLSASFKNETTKTLVSVLDALDKNEIVYLTGLKVKKGKDKIEFDFTIATLKQRRSLEE